MDVSYHSILWALTYSTENVGTSMKDKENKRLILHRPGDFVLTVEANIISYGRSLQFQPSMKWWVLVLISPQHGFDAVGWTRTWMRLPVIQSIVEEVRYLPVGDMSFQSLGKRTPSILPVFCFFCWRPFLHLLRSVNLGYSWLIDYDSNLRLTA